MQKPERPAQRGAMGYIWAPLMAIAAIASLLAVIGRPKATRRKLRPSDADKVMQDPRVSKAVEAAQRALDEAREQLASRDGRRIQEEVSRRAGSAIDSTRTNLPPSMKDAGDRAREMAERLRVEGQARSTELGQRLREEVAPKARVYAQEALDEAEDILSSARERATEFSKSARRDYGPEVSSRANALAAMIAAGSSTGVHLLRERFEEMSRDNKRKRGRGVTKRGKQRVSTAMQAAGSQAKYVATESAMLGFWAGMLGVTVYFAILTHEQRERLKSFCTNAFSQLQDVVGDFQSEGEEFQSMGS